MGIANRLKPCWAAATKPSTLVDATHTGGYGDCTGRGYTATSGISQSSLEMVTGSPSAANNANTVSTLVSHNRRDCSNGWPNTWYSSGDAPRPVPNSTLPPEITSNVATRSA